MIVRAAFPLLASFTFLTVARAAGEQEAPAEQHLQNLRGVRDAHFNHDASRVFVHMTDGRVGLWAVEEGTSVAGDIGVQTPAAASFVSKDGRHVVVAANESVRVFETTDGRAVSPPIAVQPRQHSPAAIAPTGETLILVEEKLFSVWKVTSGENVARIPIPPLTENDSPEATPAAVFAQDGAYCFVHDGLGTVTRYDAKSWQPAGKPMKHPPAESAYDFIFDVSDDGRWLATSDSPGENGPKANLQLWDAAAGKPLGKPIVSVNGFHTHFLKGTNRIVIGPARGTTSVRELPGLKSLFTLRPHDDVDEPSVAVSPDAKWILSWGPDHILNLYDVAAGKLAQNRLKAAAVSDVIMAPDSSACYISFDNSAFLTEGHHDNYVVRFSLPALEITHSMRILDYLHRVALSPDGRRLLVVRGGSDQERLVIFDAATLKPLPSYGAEEAR